MGILYSYSTNAFGYRLPNLSECVGAIACLNQISTDSEVALELPPRVRASPKGVVGPSSGLGVE